MSYYGYYADAAHGGAEAFSNPYNITIAFWYYDLGYVEIDNGVANGIYLSTSPTFARAHSDDDFDPGHTAALTFSLNTGVWHHAAGVSGGGCGAVIADDDGVGDNAQSRNIGLW